MTVTALYASTLALLFVALSARTIMARRRARVALGDGGDRILQRRLRAHGNFAEYVPIVLILMALAEFQGTPDGRLHLLGGALLAGRCLHAMCVSREPEPIRLRVAGMVLTFGALIGGALANLRLALPVLGAG
jgi:uncharacterized membrane protein YecN with MAPEG domain